MFNLKHLIAIAAIPALVAVPGIASASDPDVQATTIPASACRPATNAMDEVVVLSNGAYVFSGNSTGTVIFYCPLPINAYTISNTGNDNDITNYRVYYRDTDRTGNAASITTRLHYRNASGLFGVGATWNSNIANLSADNTTYNVSLNHDLGTDRLYFFVVTMSRTNTTQDPAFSGIDFPAHIEG